MIIINENTSQRLLYQLQLPEKGAIQEYLVLLPLRTQANIVLCLYNYPFYRKS